MSNIAIEHDHRKFIDLPFLKMVIFQFATINLPEVLVWSLDQD